MDKNSVPNIWSAQENVIRTYKMTSLGLGAVVIILILGLIAQMYQNPVVVVRSGSDQEFYIGQRQPVAIGKPEVEAFTRNFLKELFEWDVFNGDLLGRTLSPFVSAALTDKIVGAQQQRYVKDLKGKKVAQSIASVVVDVQDTKVVCRLDRILRIEGVPLVIPTEITLTMEQGPKTRLNRMGIYITGILENTSAK